MNSLITRLSFNLSILSLKNAKESSDLIQLSLILEKLLKYVANPL